MKQDWYKTWWTWSIAAGVLACVLVLSVVLPAVSASKERQAAIENYINLEVELSPKAAEETEYGTSYVVSGDYIDQGDFVEVDFHQTEFRPYEASEDVVRIAGDQITADMLASDINCPVMRCDYAEEGFLFSIQIGYPYGDSQGVDERTKQAISNRLEDLNDEAEGFAIPKRDEILQARCAELLAETSESGDRGFADVSYSIDSNGAWVNATLNPGLSFTSVDGRKRIYSSIAQMDTRLLRQNVGYRFYLDNGELTVEAYSPMQSLLVDPRNESTEQS